MAYKPTVYARLHNSETFNGRCDMILSVIKKHFKTHKKSATQHNSLLLKALQLPPCQLLLNVENFHSLVMLSHECVVLTTLHGQLLTVVGGLDVAQNSDFLCRSVLAGCGRRADWTRSPAV